MNINSYMPVQIISGKGCFNENYKLLEKLGKSCLIVTGGNSAKKCGALSDVVAVLEKLGISYSVFDGITENPQTADCHRAGECARSIDADFIIGIGGGSPLDASKAIAIYASNPDLAPV
ncbi:MAG: iron-containing alcohol dehydrogenase, partial [Clostridia bacterium]|nr:iron-containing alcohol dehydrogenase [Clostridia bacterium]